jgi:hypothetical protein
VKKTLSILLLCFYVFGITKLGFVYSTHDFFHHISHEEHSDTDCAGSCTIIIDAEKSDTHSDTKSFKISIENISTHLLCSFDFLPDIPHQIFIANNITVIPPKLLELASPPPKI